jgi:hypothetical protein
MHDGIISVATDKPLPELLILALNGVEYWNELDWCCTLSTETFTRETFQDVTDLELDHCGRLDSNRID